MTDLDLIDSSYEGVTVARLNSRPFLNIMLQKKEFQWNYTANIAAKDIETFEVLEHDEVEDYMAGARTAEITRMFFAYSRTSTSIGNAAGNLVRKAKGSPTALEVTVRVTTKDNNWVIFKVHELYAKRLAGKLSLSQIRSEGAIN